MNPTQLLSIDCYLFHLRRIEGDLLLIKFVVKKMIYEGEGEFKIFSCKPLDRYEKLVVDPKWGNFTVSGKKLNFLHPGKEYEFELENNNNEKYPTSYHISSFSGITSENGKFKIPRDNEFSLLIMYMNENQAKNCLKVEPDFVEKILNGQENEIDYKKIKNVASKRFKEYVKRIKDSVWRIAYVTVAIRYGIESDSLTDDIREAFPNGQSLEVAILDNPYDIYINYLDMSFSKADKKVLQYLPQFKDSKLRCEYAIADILKENESDGHTKIDIEEVRPCIENNVPTSFHWFEDACKDSELIYYNEQYNEISLKSTMLEELDISQAMAVRYFYPKPLNINVSSYREIDGIELTDEQMNFLETAIKNNITVLNAPGGSGKSQSTRALIRILEDNDIDFHLFAPTGVAAVKLSEYTGRKASTIHMFLFSTSKKYEQESPYYVIIDEMSMVDVHIMAQLLKCFDDNARYVLICDTSQLPSVGCGNVVQDIINSGVCNLCTFTKIFRYGIGGISTVAEDFRQGRKLTHNFFNDFKFIEIDANKKEAMRQIIREYSSLIDTGYKKSDITVISPYKIHTLGSIKINNILQKKFNKRDFTGIENNLFQFKLGDKVINIENDYNPEVVEKNEELTVGYIEYKDSEGKVIERNYEDGYELVEDSNKTIMNGDVGIVIDFNPLENYLYVQFRNAIIRYTEITVKSLNLAYCITIHKMQGQQSKAIIAIIDESHASMLNRNIEYTAASRAQEYLCIIGNEEIINDSLQFEINKERDTWLYNMLNEYKEAFKK